MLHVARQMPVDLPRLIFQAIRAEAVAYTTTGLPYGLLLTQFLHAQMVPEGPQESKGYQLNAICKNTLSRSFAQLRHQAGQGARHRAQGGARDRQAFQEPLSVPLAGESSTQASQSDRPSWANQLVLDMTAAFQAALNPLQTEISALSARVRKLEDRLLTVPTKMTVCVDRVERLEQAFTRLHNTILKGIEDEDWGESGEE